MQAIQRGSQFFNRTPVTPPSLLDSLILKRRPDNRERERGGKGKEGDQMCWFSSDKDEKRMMTPFFLRQRGNSWQVNAR